MDKKILIFSTSYYPNFGGAEVAIKELTDRLPEFSFQMVCARLRPGLPKNERIGNVQIHRVGFGSTFDKYFLPFVGPLCGLRLVKTGTPVWSMMASYAGLASLFYSWIRPKTKLLLTLQEGDPLETYAKKLGPFAFLQSMLFKRADHVQAISRFLGEWAVRGGFKSQPEIIPNGVDIKKFSLNMDATRRNAIRSGFGFGSEDIVLMTASRLSLKNAIDDVIRALPMMPERCKFLIAGLGEDEAMLKALVHSFGLDSRVVFAGYRNQDELPELFHASDIFIRPSLSEGQGIAFLEAMAAEIPMIATPVGGIPDFLTDGETGIFCQPRNPESIAKAVDRLLAEPGLRERIVANGAKLVRERYDWDRIVEKMRQLFHSL